MGDGITFYKSEVEILYNKLDSNIVQAYISSSTVKSTDPVTGEKSTMSMITSANIMMPFSMDHTGQRCHYQVAMRRA
jgi:hypothetical protein